jgi:alkanesulfonate monooxygenase
VIASLRVLAELGVTHYHATVPLDASITPIELIGQRIIPVLEDF